MRYQDLQVSLRERYRRLMVARHSEAGNEVSHTVDWILKQPALCSILTEAELVEPDSDVEVLLRGDRRIFAWPTKTEAGRASLIWKIMTKMAREITNGKDSGRIGFTYSRIVSSKSNINDSWREFAEVLLQPLFDYLGDNVTAESSMLYTLERYVKQVEWFDRKYLYNHTLDATRKTEDVYDKHLRKFLFSEGINMPFSQARSASGESDVLAELDGKSPLVCEVKVFDADHRKKREIAFGFNQIVHYATDYGKQVGYLVVVNLSGRTMNFPTEDNARKWPPYVTTSGVRVYFISVRALPMPSASKQGKANPVSITHSDLLDPDQQ